MANPKRSTANPKRSASAQPSTSPANAPASWEVEFQRMAEDFADPHQEWRRLFSEFLGTFLLVLVAAGAA